MRRAAGPLLLLASLVLIVGLALAGGSGRSAGADSDPSSRSAGSGGTLALYTWLGDLGLDVHRISGSFDLASSDVVVLAEPTTALRDDDVRTLDGFLRGGGELVLALDSPAALAAAAPLLEHLGQPVTGLLGGGRATPVQALVPGDQVRHVEMGGSALDLSQGSGDALLRLDRSVVMRGVGVGKGNAFVLGSAYPLRNSGLRATRPDANGVLQPTGSDAYALVLDMLERAHPLARPPLRVGFDDFHHGEGAHGGAAEIFGGPLGLAGLLAALGVIAFLAGQGRRLGRPVPAGDATRVPSAAEYVGAMAQLFARSADRGAVAERFAQELKERVAAASGVDPHLDDASFVTALDGFGAERRDEVAHALASARTLGGRAPTEAALLTLVRHIDDVEAHWTAGAPA